MSFVRITYRSCFLVSDAASLSGILFLCLVYDFFFFFFLCFTSYCTAVISTVGCRQLKYLYSTKWHVLFFVSFLFFSHTLAVAGQRHRQLAQTKRPAWMGRKDGEERETRNGLGKTEGGREQEW